MKTRMRVLIPGLLILVAGFLVCNEIVRVPLRIHVHRLDLESGRTRTSRYFLCRLIRYEDTIEETNFSKLVRSHGLDREETRWNQSDARVEYLFGGTLHICGSFGSARARLDTIARGISRENLDKDEARKVLKNALSAMKEANREEIEALAMTFM